LLEGGGDSPWPCVIEHLIDSILKDREGFGVALFEYAQDFLNSFSVVNDTDKQFEEEADVSVLEELLDLSHAETVEGIMELV